MTLSLVPSPRMRLFLVAWLLYSAHFATNVVREHYPAFSIAEHGTFRVDEYEGFHSDIFRHTDGHAYINNNVLVSTLAAVPLLAFDPVLDALEAYSQRKLAAEGVTAAEYRTDKPLRVAFFRLVKERGLDLRFGAATAITTIAFMAPFTAWLLVLVFDFLVARGVTRHDAGVLALLLGFGTPLFFRTTGLNHNMFVMYFTFAAFLLVTPSESKPGPSPLWRGLLAGLCMGLTVATDYVGVSIVPVLFAYALIVDRPSRPLHTSAVLVAGALPAAGFLLFSQWAMFGHPMWPAQHWMPAGNEYAARGLNGMTWPQWDLFLQNLFHPGFGLLTWGPLFALAVVPTSGADRTDRVLSVNERWFVAALSLSVILFSSANQFARLQWNSGFRYLVPLVPFLFLLVADHWRRWPAGVKVAVGAAAVLHSWVLTVFREPVGRSWELFLGEGVQLPWLRVAKLTAAPGTWWADAWWIPTLLLGLTLGVAWWIWRLPGRAERLR